jgi:hypothetical protein
MGQGANPDKNPIEQIYQSELGRAPDESGLTNWTNLYNTGMSLDDIRQQIGSSGEGQRYDINTMYREDLGRDADIGGLNSWMGALQGGMSLDDIRNQGIRGSQEFMNRQATPTYPSYPEPPVYTSPDRPDYPGEPPQYIRPDYPGEPPQYMESPNYPAGFDPITGTAITPRPAQTQGFGYGTTQQPFVFPNGFNSEMLDESGQVIGYRDPTRRKNIPIDSRQLQTATGEYYYPGELFPSRQQTDPVMDFVQNIDQQLPYLQRAFQEQLQILGDPAAAARAVLRSLR